jgi:hypothetical protein
MFSVEDADRRMRPIFIVVFAFALLFVGPTVYAQTDSADSSRCGIREKSPEGWDRYFLDGPNGDAICVYLPHKPEKFAGGKLRGGDTPISADIYLTGGDKELYAVVFMYDLPKKSEDMSDEQKAEIFFGTWRGVVEHDRQVIEKATGHPVEVEFRQQEKLTVMGHSARVQLFKVGSNLGQARVVFVGTKAYMLLGVWPPERAQQRSTVFFDRFEMHARP